MERVEQLVAKYGLARVEANASALLDHSEELIRAELAAFPEGEFSAEDFLDDDGISADPVRIRVSYQN